MADIRILGAGDNVVDRYLDVGSMFPGGNALNVAVMAKRCGASTAYLGRVGDDAAGRRVLHALRAEGVDDSMVDVYSGPNAYADVRVVGDDRLFVGSSKEDSAFELSERQLTWISGFDAVHTAYSGSLVDAVPEIARVSRVSFDFGSGFDPLAASRLLPHLYFATVSLGHGRAGQAADRALELVRAGATFALVTLGSAGAVLASAERTWSQRAVPVAAVDTLGAGDTFIAATLVGLLRGDPVEAALVAASLSAAQACTHYGAFGYGSPLRMTGAGARPVHDKAGRP